MLSTSFEKRIKLIQIISNQIPEFVLDENPKFLEFLKQYYISQEHEGGPSDLIENLDQYLNFDFLNEKIKDVNIKISSDITSLDTNIKVSSTEGFPPEYGLLKIDDEIITYKKIKGNTFVDCARGFCGTTSLNDIQNPEELVFSSSVASSHKSGSSVTNLSVVFLKEFYKKLKYIFAPGFENFEFTPDLNINSFISRIKSFYQAKGTDESIKILFKVLYNEEAKILNLEDFLIKPSDANYLRRNIIVCDLITKDANPAKLVGQQIKSSDGLFSGPVSKVDISTKNNKVVYKIHLFYGYSDDDLIEGNFKVTPKTKITDTALPGSKTISVDSTLGFSDSGSFTCGDQKITYKGKSSNQFYGCSGIYKTISSGSNLYFSDYSIYGYEDGDPSKKVEFLVIGSLSKVEGIENFNLLKQNDVVELGEFGEDIRLDVLNPTEKEYSFNSWIYNVRTSYDIEVFTLNSPKLFLYEFPDETSLKENDYVDILVQDSEEVILSNVVLKSINGKILTLDTPISGAFPYQRLSIRRRYNYASSSIIPIKFDNVLSDVQNTYIYENDLYIASNSLPSRTINLSIKQASKNITSSKDADEFFSGLLGGQYTELSFENEVPFLTGDVVKYFYTTSSPISGLDIYEEFYVEVLPLKNKIRLYSALSFLPVKDFLRFDKTNQIGTHRFVLSQHSSQIIVPSNSLKKIPFVKTSDLADKKVETEPGIVGSLINGVDIINYKSLDRVFYGPLERIDVSNPGFNYDIITPPSVQITSPNTGIGTTALVNLVVSGSFKEVLVDPQQYGIERIISISAKGGNGKGAVFEPIIKKQFREISFNAQTVEYGGSVNPQNDNFYFQKPHGLQNGEAIVYNSNGNLGIGIGSFGGSNLDSGKYLVTGGTYYAQVINPNSIQIYSTFSDFGAGINTVGLTTANAYGIHKFRLYNPIKVLSYVRIVNPGEGYTNRVLRVKPSGIGTQTDYITFTNHNFRDGDLINYSYETSGISGLNVNKKYYILKIDNDNFQLSDGGNKDEDETNTSKSNYIKRNPVRLGSNGSGYQIFSYPKISLTITAEYSSGASSDIKLTPVVRGSVIDAYLYEKGSDYGSTGLNLNIKPLISINKGTGAQLKPLIINGKIISVQVQNKGNNYDQNIDLEVVGDGLGCKLRAVIVNGLIESVIVLNSGIGYSNNCSIIVSSPGQGAVLVPTIRSLTVNDYYRYPGEFYLQNKEKNGLIYGVNGYYSNREGKEFNDPNVNTLHSRIIGWARDGNPIYGPYGYENPTSFSSKIIRLKTGYSLLPENIQNRPSLNDLPAGFFVEDYTYTNAGNLDEHNGRFTKTPEFPNGTYAYFASTKLDLTTSAITETVPNFPYFIGNTYRSRIINNFDLDQNVDLDDTKLLRNTSPYRVNRKYSSNYFIPKNFGIKQKCDIKSVELGSIDKISVDVSGENYSVGDKLIFDNTNTGGIGAYALIESVYNNSKITELSTSYYQYENVSFSWKNNNTIVAKILPSHDLSDQDSVEISGLSTSSIKGLSGNHKIKVESSNAVLLRDLNAANNVGVITDLYLDRSLPNVSIGSSVSIDQEKFVILNIFENNILRCVRYQTGMSHSTSSVVSEIPCTFKIDLNTSNFNSEDKTIIYFNPNNSIGVGSLGGSETLTTQYYADFSEKVSIPTRSIYLPNHPFETNQLVKFSISPAPGSASLVVSNTSSGYEFPIPSENKTTQNVYVINKSKDFIGIVTQVGLTTLSSGLYFSGNASNKYDYKFETVPSTNFSVTGTVTKIRTKITTSLSHGLKNGDIISLDVTSQKTVGGISTSSPLVVKYNTDYNKLLLNPIGFNSSAVNAQENTITISSHNFFTGQKVFYNTQNYTNGGISTGIYFINKVDSNRIKLCKTHSDSISFPTNEINIQSIGGSNQEISLVNPQILSIRNNNLAFNLSDPSLSGYEFNIFYDKDFNKNFVSTGSTSQFNLSTSGIVGENGSMIINYDENIPTLYYCLSKNGNPIFKNYSEIDYQILFTNSLYNNSSYVISSASEKYFYISLKNIPESLTYSSLNSDIKYYTSSEKAIGPISKIKLLNGGSSYKQLPRVVGVDTSFSKRLPGSNAIISISSKTIGKFKSIEITNDGYDYPSDNTLRPSANINSLILLTNNEEIKDINILSGGKNFLSKPNYVILDTLTRKTVDSGNIELSLVGSSIGTIKIIKKPKGLSSSVHRLFTVNNSNGVSIIGVTTVINGVVNALVRTPPIYGYSVAPFNPGDYVFIEGVQKGSVQDEFGNLSYPGDGFNSKDHGYKFFKVVDFVNDPGNAVLKYDVSPYTLNPGVPVISQSTYSSAINEKDYPTFEITQQKSSFSEGETVYVNDSLTDLEVKGVLYNSINLSKGTQQIKKLDVIKGTVSGSQAVVSDIFDYKARFSYSSSSKSNLGWLNDTGKLNFDTQALPDNDYYQNLSYSIKSKIPYEKFSEAVSKLVHPIGTKNFGQIGFASSSKTSIGGTSSLSTILTIDNERRVDIIKDYDLGSDYESLVSSSSQVRLKNKKLSNYIECRSNRVLQIDDISNSFSSSEFNKDAFLETISYNITDFYSKFLIQVFNNKKTSTEELSYQISDLVILNDFKNTYTLNKSNTFTNFDLGYFEGQINNVGDPSLRFNPSDPYETSYNIKIYREYFSPGDVVGFGFTDYGFLRLFSESKKVSNTVGFTTSVFRASASQYHTIQSSSLIINTKDYSLNYYEVVGTYDGTNTHLSEFYFDSSQYLGGFSAGYIGTFGLTVNSGVLSLNFTNNTNDNIIIKTKTIGIGRTSLGKGVCRFLADDQIPDTEKTSRIESDYSYIVGISTIKKFDTSVESALKSLVRISIGSTIAIYQLITIGDQQYTKIQSDPFITIGASNGIGTFSSINDGPLVSIVFYPDPKFASSSLLIQSIDQYLYTDFDEYNVPNILSYGSANERMYFNRYGSINKYGKDRLDFDLNWNRVPIFEKIFNPKNSDILDLATGVLTIKNHFFEDGEELIYTPDSTLIGVAASAIGIGTTLVSGTYFVGDSIVGFKTVTGLASTEGIIINNNNVLIGPNVPYQTSIIGIAKTYTYFSGNVSVGGSSVITGIANTNSLKIGSGIFSGNNVQYGTIVNIGINSIASSQIIPGLNNGLYYSNNLNYAATLSKSLTSTSFRNTYHVGIITDICPKIVYAKKLSENTFSLTGTKSGIAFTFTSTGSGNIHKLEMKKKLEKTILTVNGVVQAPIAYTPLNKTLSGNNSGQIGIANTFISLSGISSVQPIDILKVNNEYMTVVNVGFGTTVYGPINGIGPIPLCNVKRGSLGSEIETHYDGDIVQIYKGSYNIVGNKIWFSEAPDGKGNNASYGDNYLPLPKSTFNGRVYLKKDYTINKIYDDISLSFNGIGRTFTLYNQNQIISTAAPGNNVLLINDIFQAPDTENNSDSNYEILSSNGISSVRFKGITLPNTTDTFTVDYDVNQNSLPRGGILVSLAFTGGYGYAPLIGVPSDVLDVQVGSGGSIKSVGFTTSIIVGLAVTGNVGPNTNIITGINTASIKKNQKVMNILNKYIDEINFVPQYVNLKVPNITNILQFDTFVSNIGINSITLSKTTNNSSSLTTSFGFDFGDEFRGSGYYRNVSVAITEKSHVGTEANVLALVGFGGSITSFQVVQGGNGYVSPIAAMSDPTYQNLPIRGVYRPSSGYGSTTGIGLSITIEVSPSKVNGISSTTSFVSDFTVTRPGYSFELGDQFTVVGLTTAKGSSLPIQPLVFTVTEVKADTFASWQVGEFDYVDSVKTLQNSIRTRFPLIKENKLLSFERSKTDPAANLIDFSTILLIFLNGVMQEPGVSYVYDGGTTVKFFEAPKFEDNISIFFYRGTKGVDSEEVTVYPYIKPGDSIQIKKNNSIPTTIDQDPRVISSIVSSDIFETGIYLGEGIDDKNLKPIDIIPQKTDVIANQIIQYKTRDSIESSIFPTAKIIKSIDYGSLEIFVDDSQFFKYESNDFNLNLSYFDSLIVPYDGPVSASMTAVVSSASTISNIIINDGGYGYTGIGNSILFKMRSISGLGGTDAIIYGSVSAAGTITYPLKIVNAGYGYTFSNPPEVIAPIPPIQSELVEKIKFVNGFSGIITGITTCSGIGTNLAIKFFTKYNQDSNVETLQVGYPIYIFDTVVGSGVTSINSNGSKIISIGSRFCDNIYEIHSITNLNLNGELICNISTPSNISGINTSGSLIKGKFSWGKLDGLIRSKTPLAINLDGYTTNSGLTTFPTIQRRGYGLRETGALTKIVIS